MKHSLGKTLLLTCSLLGMGISADTGLTIYSKAQPGSVSAAQFRPGGQWSHYNQIPGYAVIRETRDVELKQSRSTVSFDNVAAYIDPTTVQFRSITDPKHTSVVEQNYQFDLVSQQKLLERYLGKTIEVEQWRGEEVDVIKGTLLSSGWGNQLVLQTENGVQSIGHYNNIRYPELPGGLRTKPTLLWDIYTKKPGTHEIETSYQTEGITWWADYNAEYRDGEDENSGYLDLNAWVSIVNKTGATYEDAKLKLIAGDVQRVSPHRGAQPMMARRMDVAEMAMIPPPPAPKGFTEKAFFEFHLYTLGRPTTLPDNSTKQTELFPRKEGIEVEKQFVFDGKRLPGKVGVYVSFENEEENGLGLPLPAGRVRVNKRDTADDSLEFIGEDIIDHTPKNDEIEIKLGNAFDVIAKREVINSNRNNDEKWRTETVKITLKNSKKNPIELIVREHASHYGNWKLIKQSHEHEKKNASTFEFPVRLKADEEVQLTYTIKRSWK